MNTVKAKTRDMVPPKITMLREVLLNYDGAPASEKSIRNRLFDDIIALESNEENIRDSVKVAMAEIRSYSLGANFGLVADCIRAWTIMHIGSASIVLRTLNTAANSYVDHDMGEGVAIGLLEAFVDEPEDDLLFFSFNCRNGTVVGGAMEAANVSSSARSRLSMAVSAFVSQIWNPNHSVGQKRLPKLVDYLREWVQSYARGPVTYLRKGISPIGEDSMKVRHFVNNELMVRFFLSAHVTAQADMLAGYLDRMKGVLCQKS